MSAYNPGLFETIPIDVNVTLVSNLQGILDIFHVTNQFELHQRMKVVNLAVAEVIVVQATQSGPFELSVNSQAITFVKLA